MQINILISRQQFAMQTFRKEYPSFSNFFNFQHFNQVQDQCYKPIMNNQQNIVVSAPTSSGKTIIFELAIIRELCKNKLKCLYLAPIKSLCHQKYSSWQSKFKSKVNVFELTGDNSSQQDITNQLQNVDLVVATPQKIDAYSRKSLIFLSKINLLLVDEVHMLNFEERGATLEAVVSRIMSINNPRVIAVSASIPNIKQVAQWLKVPQQMTFVFGEQFRPVKLNKVVLGFKSSNNPYTFEKMLNYKLLEVIRTYSDDKGVLVFCQTQKGTESACQQIISDMRERQFIDSDQSLISLIQSSKRVINSSLQIMIPQGIAFHNASLTHQDRTIVQNLFLESKLKILCTTSTLAMGINLPARLVVIKSTQCYRGSGKGYQQYTQIEMDQMMGRAGRPPFDTFGTVVIMTEKQNYNKYLNSGKLQVLQSHLFDKLAEHINAQISLKSISSLPQTIKYFMNSFCYIRMKNSPISYNVKGNLQVYLENFCTQLIDKLSKYNFIQYYPQNLKVIPKALGINVARNSIQIQTMIKILNYLCKVKSQRDYLSMLCDCEQTKRYRNKLDERKTLKEINEGNKYVIKGAISTTEKKCYVLVQCELDGRHIDNWQLRKQAKDLLYFMKRLTFCIKCVATEQKLFWPCYWSNLFIKQFTVKFWGRNEQMGIRQFEQLNQKWKVLSLKGFKNIDHVMNNLKQLDIICQKNNQFSESIRRSIDNLKQQIFIKVVKNNEFNKNIPIQHKNDPKNSMLLQIQSTDENSQSFTYNQTHIGKDTLIIINFMGYFDEKLKSLLIIVGQSHELYTVRTLNENCKETTIAINSNKKYNLAIIKNYYIGFDQFYQIQEGSKITKIQNIGAIVDLQSVDRLNKIQKQKYKNTAQAQQQTKSKSLHSQKTNQHIQCKSLLKAKKLKQKNIKSIENQNKKNSSVNKRYSVSSESTKFQNRKPLKPKNISQTNKNNRKKCPEQIQGQLIKLNMKPGTYIPLQRYGCWRPGFDFLKSEDDNQKRKTLNKQLRLIDEGESKQKLNQQVSSLPTVKSKNGGINWQSYLYNIQTTVEKKKRQQSNPAPMDQIKTNTNPYDYFLNLFTS